MKGSEKFLKMSFRNFVDGYSSTCSCLSIIAVGIVEVQLSFDEYGSYNRRSFRVVGGIRLICLLKIYT